MIFDRKTRFLVAALLIFSGPWSVATGFAQTTANKLSTKQTNQVKLNEIAERLKLAKERQAALRDEIAGYDKDIGAINRALIASARRGQELEAEVSRAEANLLTVTKTQGILRKSMQSKRALLGEVLAALQRMGRKPPPALLVRPEDALASVRSAILLGAVVPEIRNETATLLSEMKALSQTTRRVKEQKTVLAEKLNALAEDEARLSLLVVEKNELTRRSEEELSSEQKKASDLAAKATSLKDLINSLEGQIASAAAAAKAAKAADDRRAKEEAKRLAKAKTELDTGKTNPLNELSGDLTRNEPAIAFAQAKGRLIRPASGVELYGFGAPTKNPRSAASNGKSRNLALATRPNARVRAPADAWVVYAGSFRSYGQLLILNAGGGYHMVLAGLAQTNVNTGRFVLAGEPIGRMGIVSAASALTVNLGSNKPVLYVELRKDGKSIDPAPWWGPTVTTKGLAVDG